MPVTVRPGHYRIQDTPPTGLYSKHHSQLILALSKYPQMVALTDIVAEWPLPTGPSSLGQFPASWYRELAATGNDTGSLPPDPERRDSVRTGRPPLHAL